MPRTLVRITVSYSQKDQEFITQQSKLQDCSETEVIRRIIDKYLENPRVPDFYDPKEQTHVKIVALYKEQIEKMDKLCRKFGNCPRVDLVREAIKMARLGLERSD